MNVDDNFKFSQIFESNLLNKTNKMKLILGNRAMRKYLLIAITVFCSFFFLIRINQPACVIDSRSEYFTAQVCFNDLLLPSFLK